MAEETRGWFADRVAADWPALRATLLELLQRERELREIAGLVGPEALQDKDRKKVIVDELDGVGNKIADHWLELLSETEAETEIVEDEEKAVPKVKPVLDDDVKAALDSQGRGALINNSRGIIFAFRDAKYRQRYAAFALPWAAPSSSR